MKKISFLFLYLIAWGCGLADKDSRAGSPPDFRLDTSYKIIGDIKVPDGCKRVPVSPGSFGEWLRAISLRKDNHVYLYNGTLKRNQSAQFAVLDIPIGKKDLQQCADAVMRLRAEYLFSLKKFDEIKFTDYAGKIYQWKGKDNRVDFDRYLEKVFAGCGSASLEKQLRPVSGIHEIKTGDVFIKGGFPGHAMLVVDMAIDDKGKKYFMLAQSYMPAQDIHIVKNPTDEKLSPWYEVSDAKEIDTPEWTFYKNQLRQW